MEFASSTKKWTVHKCWFVFWDEEMMRVRVRVSLSGSHRRRGHGGNGRGSDFHRIKSERKIWSHKMKQRPCCQGLEFGWREKATWRGPPTTSPLWIKVKLQLHFCTKSESYLDFPFFFIHAPYDPPYFSPVSLSPWFVGAFHFQGHANTLCLEAQQGHNSSILLSL